MQMTRRGRLALPLAAFVLAAAAHAGQGFKPLFNGKNMDDFVLVEVKPETFKVEDGVIVCSGQPNGYFATKKSYKNYFLRFDWKYVRPAGLEKDDDFQGNSGLLIHIDGEHKVWPKCIEVQLMNKDAGNIFGLGSEVRAKKDDQAQKKAIKPVGEWNSEEVVCQDGKITAKINGVVVAEGTGARPAEGPIGWQSEGAEIHFRNLTVKEL